MPYCRNTECALSCVDDGADVVAILSGEVGDKVSSLDTDGEGVVAISMGGLDGVPPAGGKLVGGLGGLEVLVG